MDRDLLVVTSIVVSFAAWLTAHVAIAAGLTGRRPRARGLVALVVPPLAPYFGAREKMWIRAAVWVVSMVVYVGARIWEWKLR